MQTNRTLVIVINKWMIRKLNEIIDVRKRDMKFVNQIDALKYIQNIICSKKLKFLNIKIFEKKKFCQLKDTRLILYMIYKDYVLKVWKNNKKMMC